MSKTKQASGSWKSPITADMVAAKSIGLNEVKAGKTLCWIESRPEENGRNLICSMDSSGNIKELTPGETNVRNAVHEYGGGSYCLNKDDLYFSNFNDHRIYHLDKNQDLKPLTPEGKFRYADLTFDAVHNRILAIQEDHTNENSEAENSLVSIDAKTGTVTRLQSGYDFYSFPRISPNGKQIAWTCWKHPHMPWEQTELWIADFDKKGEIQNPFQIAGQKQESIFQPEWSPDGTLYFVSDRHRWWNIYKWQDNEAKVVLDLRVEFASPQWVFGMSHYQFLDKDRIFCSFTRAGKWHIGIIPTDGSDFEEIFTPLCDVSSVAVYNNKAYFKGGFPDQPSAIMCFDPETGELETIRSSYELTLDSGYLSQPESLEFPTEFNENCHAFYYPPANQEYEAEEGELPPLLVKSHGGPTAATSSALNMGIQYWTSRGFAVLDVNYGGSTGFNRSYRHRLNEVWGVVDVNDCVNGARAMVKAGRADEERLAIRGSSAGGYTTLAALTFRNTFKAGASYYGISDLEALQEETHKFESRYNDWLIGQWPDEREIYLRRSPINHVDQLSCPVIFFQGTEDKVVPPGQAEKMALALKEKGLPVAFLPFEGEQHGFRKASTIIRALEAELYFYGKIFGFTPADSIDPVQIDNL